MTAARSGRRRDHDQASIRRRLTVALVGVAKLRAAARRRQKTPPTSARARIARRLSSSCGITDHLALTSPTSRSRPPKTIVVVFTASTQRRALVVWWAPLASVCANVVTTTTGNRGGCLTILATCCSRRVLGELVLARVPLTVRSGLAGRLTSLGIEFIVQLYTRGHASKRDAHKAQLRAL